MLLKILILVCLYSHNLDHDIMNIALKRLMQIWMNFDNLNSEVKSGKTS